MPFFILDAKLMKAYGLNGAEQTAVNQCVEIAKTIHRGITAAQDANATKILSDLRITFVPVSTEQKQMFREAGQPTVREFIVSEVGKDWLSKLDAAIDDYRNQQPLTMQA